MSISRRSLLKSAVLATAVSCFVVGGAWANTVKVALVLPGSITDGGWNQGAYEGLKALEAKGFKITFTENVAQDRKSVGGQRPWPYGRRLRNLFPGRSALRRREANE